MRTASFIPDGGPIQVDIRAGFAQPGSYSLVLWGANSNTIVQEWRGNFLNTESNSYYLSVPTNEHDGRLLNFIATFALLPPIKDYQLEVIVSQDGSELEREIRASQSDELTVSVQIIIKLEKK